MPSRLGGNLTNSASVPLCARHGGSPCGKMYVPVWRAAPSTQGSPWLRLKARPTQRTSPFLVLLLTGHCR